MTNISNYFEQAELAFAAYSDLETEMTDAAYKLGIIGDKDNRGQTTIIIVIVV